MITNEEKQLIETLKRSFTRMEAFYKAKSTRIRVYEEKISQLEAESAVLRERLEKAATFALDMCSEDDCAGDGSVGLPPCDMWHAWDTDENGVNIESGCYLKEYLAELKDRGQIK